MRFCARIQKRLKKIDINISFTCDPGQVLAVVGPSGAGKTTILRTIAGLEKPDKGCVVFNETAWFDSYKRVNLPPQKRKVGYVSQGYGLFPHLTVEKNISFAAKKPEAVSGLMDLFSITGLAGSKPDEISGGERQRAAFAQALAAEPHIMLLDEPFSALDYKTKEKLRSELVRMKESLAMPIIMVTHDLEEAICLADKILPVAGGVLAPEWLPETMECRLPAPYGGKRQVNGSGIDAPLSGHIAHPVRCSL